MVERYVNILQHMEVTVVDNFPTAERQDIFYQHDDTSSNNKEFVNDFF